MINKITLTNDQAITLYNFLQNTKLDRAKNRNRWKFLEVIEEVVFAYENERDEKVALATQSRQQANMLQSDQRLTFDEKVTKQEESATFIKKIQEELKTLSKKDYTFEFNDREVFAQGKAIFEISSADPTKPEELTGQDSKIIKQIEDAFLNAQQVNAPTTQAAPAQPAKEGTN